MSNYATIAQLLISELYNAAGTTNCGPDLAYTQYHPDVKLFPTIPAPLITPSQCFHPKLAVVFDFFNRDITGSKFSRNADLELTKWALAHTLAECRATNKVLFQSDLAYQYSSLSRKGYPYDSA